MSDVHEYECAAHKGWHGETRCAWCMTDEIKRLRALLQEGIYIPDHQRPLWRYRALEALREMNDIVVELSNVGVAPNEICRTCQKAKAEIERLRMELTKVGNNSYNPALVIAERDAEIERLKKRLADPCYAALWEKTEEAAQLRTENERLQEEVVRWQEAHDHQRGVADTLLREAERYSRENEELRGLHTRIAKILG